MALGGVSAYATEFRGVVTFNGLPVPNAGVTVTATQGDKKETALTDDQGFFHFADLTDGTWTVEIAMTGFAPVKQQVAVSAGAPVGTFELKLLSLADIRAGNKPVKVEPGAMVPPAVATAATTAATAPGKAAPGNGKPAANGQQQAAAGPAPVEAPQPANEQASDGLLINGSVNNAATSQFALNQAFGNARNSRSLYNGGLMLTLDNSSLDAKQYSISGLPVANPAYNNFTAGIQVGGPFKIGKLLPAARAPFVYLQYQRIQQNTNNGTPALVPTLAQRTGNLSAVAQKIYIPANIATVSPGCNAYLLGTGLSQTAINSGTATFTGNQIPAACISSQAQAMLNFYPLPNATGSAVDNFQATTTSNQRQDAFQTFGNKQFGNKNNANWRLGLQSTRTGNTSLFGFHDSTDNFGLNFNGQWYHRFTQRFSQTATYNYSRSRTNGVPFFSNRQNVEGAAGITGVDTDPNYWGPPGLTFQQSAVYGLSDGISQRNRNQTHRLSYQVDWNKFRHNVEGGIDFSRREFNIFSQSNPRGGFSFTGAATAGGVTAGGSDFADFLLGIPDTSAIGYGNPDKYLRENIYDAYVRDDFRVNPEFSINYGARWEYSAPITETQNRLVNLDLASGFTAEAPVLASSPKGAVTGQSYPTALMHPDRLGIAPNVGIAWRPISGSSLLVRAGYAIYHDTSGYQAMASSLAVQSPLSRSLTLNNQVCALTMVSGFSACPSITPNNFAVDPNYRVGYAQIWQISAQRDLPGALQAIVTYQGTKGTRSPQEYYPNTYAYGATAPCVTATAPNGVIDCPTGFIYRTSNGDSTREAGSVQLRRRLRSGFTAQINYTFSKALDDAYQLGGQGPVAAGTISQGSTASGQIAQDWRHPEAQRGLSTFDQRHVLSVQAQYTTGMGLGGHSLMSGWKGAAYKEWTFLTNINTASGTPESPVYAVALPGTSAVGVLRPDSTGQSLHASGLANNVYINPAAFSLPANGLFGDARRDSIPGPLQFTMSASMARTFRLHDRFNLDARLDASNAINHVEFSNWVTQYGSPLFGTPASANTMRQISLTFRLRY